MQHKQQHIPLHLSKQQLFIPVMVALIKGAMRWYCLLALTRNLTACFIIKRDEIIWLRNQNGDP